MSETTATLSLRDAIRTEAANALIAAVNDAIRATPLLASMNIAERNYAFTAMLAQHVTMLPPEVRASGRALIDMMLETHIRMATHGTVAGHA